MPFNRHKVTRSLQAREIIPLVRVMGAMMIIMVAPLRMRSSTRTISYSNHIHDNVARGLFLCLEATHGYMIYVLLKIFSHESISTPTSPFGMQVLIQCFSFNKFYMFNVSMFR